MLELRPINVSLIGHPFAPIGMGEHVRCTFRAMRSVALRPAIRDIYKLQKISAAERTEFEPYLSDGWSDINVFHINADEVDQALAHLEYHEPRSGYNIIYPAWELSQYPEEWARKLERFDEIWAPSRFIADSIRGASRLPVHHMPLACEVILESILSRRFFGIPDGAFTFLFFFDVKSFPERKNPTAVIEAFERLLAARPTSRARLIVKVNGADQSTELLEALRTRIAPIQRDVTLLTGLMTDNEVKNLMRCSDCFISLHRSEGFGRGLAEAMCLGKPVIGTSYSGNTDFMNAENSCLVPFQLVSVAPGSYPFSDNQVWADPDIAYASNCMTRLIDSRDLCQTIGSKAATDMLLNFGNRAAGLRFRHRLEAIRAQVSRIAELA
jgi:glycosyltransferase involved in cell wall biosynthesis